MNLSKIIIGIFILLFIIFSLFMIFDSDKYIDKSQNNTTKHKKDIKK